ncbi:hypothetical protein PPL_08167 [Heterostelium album PN500]|uniref:C-type lectin domain-containing protein n=1 Tax=Heterostelium pallidum (strain ATCC 26659 / Pp 5 / PN500) TaxID=670386 RepID=D3BIT2_HETP5|nr:hypothetical protein PPL_08167 [Heterostelium album PN500]EFA78706.1 hypothetical protein PPL_08167 [Heterostelium album PN500]|eukprot:XP_020430830.1 hypothetical protein PPL_08167 [Heterostelium album PN500]
MRKINIFINTAISPPNTAAIYNPSNGHYYQYLDEKSFTYGEALNIQQSDFTSNISTSYKYYLLTLNDYAEYQFIMNLTKSIQLDVWLGAVPMDVDQNSWAWRNGTARSQAFYTTYPERCYQFCGDFSGNLNTSQPHLWFQTYGASLNFFGADATSKKYVILEFEQFSDGPILMYQDSTATEIPITLNNIGSITAITFEGSNFCNSIVQNNLVAKCLLSPSLIKSGRSIPLVITSGSNTWTTTYQFNSPWIFSMVQKDANTYIFQGINLDLVSPIEAYPLSVSGTLYTPSRSASSAGILQWTIPANQVTAVSKLKIQTTQSLYVTINRIAIYDGTTQRFYSYFPNINNYLLASKITAASTLMYNTAIPALDVVSSNLNTFFNQKLGFSGSNYWTSITVNSSGTFWNNQPITATIQGTTQGPYYFYNSLGPSIVGMSQAEADAYVGVNMGVILVYGYGEALMSTPYSFGSDAGTGATLVIPMISNFFAPEVQITSNVSSIVTTAEFNSRSIFVMVPKATNYDIVYAKVTIKSNYTQDRTITFKYSINTPNITSVTFNPTTGRLAITGTSFIYGLQVKGFKNIWTGSEVNELGYMFQDFPGTYQIYLVDTFNTVRSPTFSFTTPNFSWYTYKSGDVPMEPSKMTVTGVEFGSNPSFYQQIKSINSEVLATMINTSAYELSLPASQTSDVSFYIVLNNTGISTLMNYQSSSSFNAECPPTSSICLVTMPKEASNGPLITYISSTTVTLESEISLNMRFIDVDTPAYTLFDDKYLVPTQARSTDSYVLYQFSEWVGVHNFTLKNIATGESSEPIAMTFHGPIVSGVTVNPNNISQITINGTYLGFSNLVNYNIYPLVLPVVTGISTQSLSPTIYDSHVFRYFNLELPNDARSGQFKITVAGQTNTSRLVLPPVVESITKLPVVGGAVTITGKFISPLSYSGESVLQASFDGVLCPVKLLNQNYPFMVEISGVPGGIGSKSLKLYNFKEYFIYNVTYQPPTVISASSTYENIQGKVTVFGTNFANIGLSVTIGNATCANPTVLDPSTGTKLECDFLSNVKANGTLVVNVTVGDQFGFADKFIYYPPPSVCVGCNTQNGQCVNGYCKCNIGYVGNNCSNSINTENKLTPVIDTPQPKDNTVTVVLGSNEKNVQFNISIHTISEMNEIGVAVKTYKFSDIKWSLESTTATNNTYNYIGKFDSDAKLIIAVEIIVFTNQTEYNFEGDIFPVQNNSMKYVITITNWTFADKLNTLELAFLSKADTSETKCGGAVQPKFGDSSVNSLKSLRTMEIVQGDIILTAYFSDRMILDGRVVYSKVSAPTDETKDGSLFVLTTMSIQHFENQVVLDPSFAALLVSDDESECSSSNNNWKLPVIVVCSVVGAVLIALVVTAVIKKNFRYKLKSATIKLRSLSRSSKK